MPIYITMIVVTLFYIYIGIKYAYANSYMPIKITLVKQIPLSYLNCLIQTVGLIIFANKSVKV